MSLLRSRLLFLLFILTAVLSAFAQIDRANLEGTVADTSGAVVAGAKVNAVAISTNIGQETYTNPRGYYRFPGLAVGRYTVTTSNSGFKTRIIENVVVQVGETRTLDVTMEVGALAEKVVFVAG